MYRRTEWIVDKGCPKKNAARGAHSSRRRRVVDPRRAVARLLEDFSSNAGLSTRFFFRAVYVSFRSPERTEFRRVYFEEKSEDRV